MINLAFPKKESIKNEVRATIRRVGGYIQGKVLAAKDLPQAKDVCTLPEKVE